MGGLLLYNGGASTADIFQDPRGDEMLRSYHPVAV